MGLKSNIDDIEYTIEKLTDKTCTALMMQVDLFLEARNLRGFLKVVPSIDNDIKDDNPDRVITKKRKL